MYHIVLVQYEIGRGFPRNEPPRSLQQLAYQVILCTVQEFTNSILYPLLLLPPSPTRMLPYACLTGLGFFGRDGKEESKTLKSARV